LVNKKFVPEPISPNSIESSSKFYSNVGVSQDEHLFPFLFSLYLNDLELLLHDRNSKGLDSIAKDIEDELDIFLRLFILLYADDTVLFSDSVEDLKIIQIKRK
jgi:hypothetical protein